MTELKATNSKYNLDTSKTHMLGSDKHYLIRSNIGVVAAVPLWPNNDEASANAHLLRSARELYDALKRARDMLQSIAGDIEDGYSLAGMREKYVLAVLNARDAAHSALRAARGEATE